MAWSAKGARKEREKARSLRIAVSVATLSLILFLGETHSMNERGYVAH